jgi:hypothetical protein
MTCTISNGYCGYWWYNKNHIKRTCYYFNTQTCCGYCMYCFTMTTSRLYRRRRHRAWRPAKMEGLSVVAMISSVYLSILLRGCLSLTAWKGAAPYSRPYRTNGQTLHAMVSRSLLPARPLTRRLAGSRRDSNDKSDQDPRQQLDPPSEQPFLEERKTATPPSSWSLFQVPTQDVMAIILSAELLGLLDALNDPHFVEHGGWWQPMTAADSTLLHLVTRAATNLLLWMLASTASFTETCDYIKTDDKKGLVGIFRSITPTLAAFLLLKVVLLTLASGRSKTEVLGNLDIPLFDALQDSYVVGLTILTGRWLSQQYFPQ